MAERSNATAKKSQDGAPDVSTLQKRGRRRLVGAIALVLLAVIVLPMVFDPEPKPNAPLVNIRIPSEDGGKFTPKGGAAALPQPAESAATKTPPEASSKTPPEAPIQAASPASPVAPVAAPSVAASPPARPVNEAKEDTKPAKPDEKPLARIAEKPSKVAEKAVTPPPGGEQIVFQVGAFASADKVKAIVDQLKTAKLPHYTESVATSGGSVTRVRLGPFTSKSAADKAMGRAKALGLNPVNVAPK